MELNIFTGDKLLKHADRIAEWQKTGDTRPITWNLSLTNVCNNKCPRCYGWMGKDGQRDTSSISFEKAKEIVDQIAEFGGKAITLTGGGEPTLHPHCIDILKYIKSKGMDVAIITNGLLLNKIDMKAILQNATWCRISLDAGTPEMYKKTHGLPEECFRQVIENIKLLTAKKREVGSECTIGTGYLTGEETLEGIEDYAKLACSLGADYATLRPFHWDTTPLDEYYEKAKKYENKTCKLLYSAHKYRYMKDEKMIRPYKMCFCHKFLGEIGADAKVYMCCHLVGIPKYCFGDLNKNTLKEIWASEQRKKAIANLKDLSECSPFCRGDSTNRVLWDIAQPRTHVNFL